MNNYKYFDGETLPKSGMAAAEKMKIFKYPCNWVLAYYKGRNPETATDWLIVTDNGGFYKVDAEFMIWWNSNKKSKFMENHYGNVSAAWSYEWCLKAVERIVWGGKPGMDPDYQT